MSKFKREDERQGWSVSSRSSLNYLDSTVSGLEFLNVANQSFASKPGGQVLPRSGEGVGLI